jgi:hypothetical protein
LNSYVPVVADPGAFAREDVTAGHSHFTLALLTALRRSSNAGKPLELAALFRETRKSLVADTMGVQRSWSHSCLTDEISLG